MGKEINQQRNQSLCKFLLAANGVAKAPIIAGALRGAPTLRSALPSRGRRWRLVNGKPAPALPGIAAFVALIQPILRLVYIGAYVGNIAPLRGLCWASALFCTGILYLEGLKALLQSA